VEEIYHKSKSTCLVGKKRGNLGVQRISGRSRRGAYRAGNRFAKGRGPERPNCGPGMTWGVEGCEEDGGKKRRIWKKCEKGKTGRVDAAHIPRVGLGKGTRGPRRHTQKRETSTQMGDITTHNADNVGGNKSNTMESSASDRESERGGRVLKLQSTREGKKDRHEKEATE